MGTVVGGRIVASSFPVNGQQLMMQVDSLTSAMMDMNVAMEEDMEDATKEGGQNKDSKRSLAMLPQQEEMQQQEQYHLQLSQYQQQQQQIFYHQIQHLLQPYSS